MIQFTNSAFTQLLDIIKSVADHLGLPHPLDVTDDSKLCQLSTSEYPKMRQAELRRNVWRFSVRRAALRPINVQTFTFPNGTVQNPTLVLTPPAYSAVTTYLVGAIVSSGGSLWMNTAPANLNNTPGVVGSGWVNFFGSLCVNPYDSLQSYYSGEMVYKSTGIGTYAVYLAVMNGASEDPAVIDTYDATATYPAGALVVSGGINYISLVDMNLNHTPVSSPTAWAVSALTNSSQWVVLTGAVLSQINFIYPIGAGPVQQQATRNVYMLPYGYLRQAPQDPKAGSVSVLGGPSGLQYNDWIFEGNYIISREAQPIVLRFAADITDISAMDSMFAHGLSARIAYTICEPVTTSTEKLKNCTMAYAKNMTEARQVNGIEEGPTEPPEDDWITCRS